MMRTPTLLLAAILAVPAAEGARPPGPEPSREAPAGPRALPPIGISLEPAPGATKEAAIAGILGARAQGFRLACLRHSWRDLEPAPGVHRLEDLEEAAKGLAAAGFEIALTIAAIDGDGRTLPWDLAGSPFEAEAVRDRFDLLLGAVAAILPPAVRWVFLGRDADDRLEDHPKELEAFAAFAERGRSALRCRRPDLLVGIASRYEGLRDRPAIAARLNREMDLWGLSYGPLGPGLSLRPLAEVRRDFARMARAAGGKPVFLAEVGCPADRLFGGEERQAASIEAILDEVARRPGEIAGANFHRLRDLPGPLVDAILAAGKVRDPRLRAYLATLGLKTADGTPRKAWERLQARVKP